MIDPRSIRNRLNASPSRRAIPRLRRAFGCSAAASGSLAPAGGKCKARGRGLAIGQVAGPFASAGCARGPSATRESTVTRALALDQTARDIIGDSSDDRVDRLAFGHQHAALARVLEESIGALIVRHVDERDHVEEEARMLALRQRQIKQVEPLRRLVDDRLQRALKRFETDNLELAHLRDRIGALGVLDPSLPDRGDEVRLDRDVLRLVVHRLVFCPLFRRESSANPADRKLSTAPQGFGANRRH